MLKYEQETSFSMQAKVVQSQSYSGDLDYITMPLSSYRSKAKIMMPATKEIMKESTRRKVKRQHTNESFSTPGGDSSLLFRDRDKGDYLNMTSSESDKKSKEKEQKVVKKEKRKKIKEPASEHHRKEQEKKEEPK